MNFQELHQRMVANWEAAGTPYCACGCQQPVMGKSNMVEWRKNGHLHPSCALSIQNVRDHAHYSVPPSGIAKE